MPHVRIAEDLELHYEEFGPAEAPAVVFVRGTGADGRRWMPQVEAYRDEFRVLIFDNRGAGQSGAPAPPYSVADMAGDTVRLLDVLGIERCHLSGSSLGGAIALDVALTWPERVLSLQLHSSWLVTHGYTRFSLGLLKRFLEMGGVSFYYEATLPMLFSVEYLSADHGRLEQILAGMQSSGASEAGLLGQIEANLSHDLRDRAAEVSVPTLVTVGELDLLLPVAASRELADAIPGAELVVFAGAGHLASMEQADEFNAVTLDWLRKVVAATA